MKKLSIVIILLLVLPGYIISKNNKVESLTKDKFFEKIVDKFNQDSFIYKGNKPAVIDFYANWCSPCIKIKPIIEDLSNEYSDKVLFYKINVDKESDLAKIFNITSIPAILFIPKEGMPTISVGLTDKKKLKEAIDKLLLK